MTFSRRLTLATLGAVAALSTSAAIANVTTNDAAPDFTGTATDGASVSLSDFAGKTVVLEWTNHGCPFVQKHYDASYANMQTLQSNAASEDVVWLTVISSAPGKQGHVSPAKADELTTSRGAAPSVVILDESGDIGRLYGAKTTPHMYVVNAEGTLVYQGAIDSIRSSKTKDIPKATNYVTAALASVAAGTPVEKAQTKPYGCSVKY